MCTHKPIRNIVRKLIVDYFFGEPRFKLRHFKDSVCRAQSTILFFALFSIHSHLLELVYLSSMCITILLRARCTLLAPIQ